MSQAMKIAVSLPLSQYKQVEALRRKKKLTRSGVIHTALEHWLHCGEEQKKILQYLEGYRQNPEKLADYKAFEKAQVSHLIDEDWS